MMHYFVTSLAGVESFGTHESATDRFTALCDDGGFGYVQAYRFSLPIDAQGRGLRLARYEYRTPNGAGAPVKYGEKSTAPAWAFVALRRNHWPACMVAEADRLLMRLRVSLEDRNLLLSPNAVASSRARAKRVAT